MRYCVLTMAGAGLSLLGAGAEAAAPPVQTLEPVANWTVNYSREQCTLLRDFGPEDNRVRLQIESYGSPAQFRFLLSGKPIPRSRAASGTVRYAFPNDTAEREPTGTLQGTTGPDVAAISFSGSFRPDDAKPDDDTELATAEKLERDAQPDLPLPEFERQVDRMAIVIGERAHLDLRLGRMEKPLAAMRQCIEAVQRSWGLDPVVQARLSRYPMPHASSVRRTQRRYPTSMVLQGISAFVPVRIMVDAQGKVTDCVVQIPQVESSFREATCFNLAREFYPALDETGEPVAGMYQTSVIYMLAP